MAQSSITVHMSEGLQGARQANGIVVIIDVLRAFTTACYVVAAGAERLFTVARRSDALALAKQFADVVLMGERDGLRIPGFDLGNSPSQLSDFEFQDRTVILTTSNGTRGLFAAQGAQQVLTGSFVNAGALVQYLHDQKPAKVSLVCMGSRGEPAIEDTLCAHYLKTHIQGQPQDFESLRAEILSHPRVTIYKTAAIADMPAEDLTLALQTDCFDFVLRAEKGPHNSLLLERVDII